MKAASVSGYSASKCSTGFVHMWLNYKRGSRDNGQSGSRSFCESGCKGGCKGSCKSSCKGSCKEQADEAYWFLATQSVISCLVNSVTSHVVGSQW